jgi:hypothetical protein
MTERGDIIDQANDKAAQDTDLAIQAARSGHPLPYIGHCYNCEHGLDAPLRFCDAHCRDDYDRRAARR